MIDRIITSTNEDPRYYLSWPLFAQIWNRLLPEAQIEIAVITDKDEDDPFVQRFKHFGNVTLVRTIEGVPTPNLAKVSRLTLASKFSDEYCCLSDIDLITLRIKFLIDAMKLMNEDELMAVGANAYDNSPEEGKFPMPYTTALGRVFKDIINPEDLDDVELVKSWKGFKGFNNKESVSNHPTKFSDESLLKALLIKGDHEGRVRHVLRRFNGMRAVERIDRANWKIDPTCLKNNFYIDAHLPKPITKDLSMLDDILDHFWIKQEEIIF